MHFKSPSRKLSHHFLTHLPLADVLLLIFSTSPIDNEASAKCYLNRIFPSAIVVHTAHPRKKVEQQAERKGHLMKWKANLNMTQNVTKQFIRLTALGGKNMEIHHTENA